MAVISEKRNAHHIRMHHQIRRDSFLACRTCEYHQAMADTSPDDTQRRIQSLRDLADPGAEMARTLDMLVKTQQQIAQTVQQVSTLAVQVHRDLAEIEKRIAQLEAKAAETPQGRRGRKGRKRRK
jgi:septal ring factor EnvC (AmiA/AmiB activator)